MSLKMTYSRWQVSYRNLTPWKPATSLIDQWVKPQTKWINTKIVMRKPGKANHKRSIWFHNFNTLRPRQNGRHFADDTFKCIFLNENVRISIKISLKFVPKGPINNIPALVQIMAWRRPGDKLLSEPMMVSLMTHLCVTRPQWVNRAWRLKQNIPITMFLSPDYYMVVSLCGLLSLHVL